MRLLALIFFSAFCTYALSGQQTGNITINETGVIGAMMQSFEQNNRDSRHNGWRVQLLATTDRQRLDREFQSFRFSYPNIPVDWRHDRPYYKLQAGAFRTRIEAERLKYLLGRDYDGLYLVQDDNITSREFLLVY